ncbi:hypothetical protein F444_06513 [Phytophthora nicotianae P1976]|uniref:Uncharacterized protein n=1 Tax=Phytophthora nicotianae P1976 TaxID=1317066 RepID=A0A081AI65_PHYNI|nr:hypothetical protein F444_06513 [Phytophthora nicotianae P1976]
MTRQSLTFQELLQGGIDTATHVIKPETRNVYESYFKKFCEFCIANEYPDPAVTRHHELPSLLVPFMESVSASSTVSNQTAEKVRAAVANFYGTYERRDAAGPDKWMVMTDDRGNKLGLGNPAKDAFVRQFMRGLKKRKNKEFTQRQATPISLDALCASFSLDTYVRIHRGKPFVWKSITLDLARPSASDPTSTIGYGVYKLGKTEVAKGRYNLHCLDECESPMDVLTHLKKWIGYVNTKTDHKWSDNDYVFPALSKIAKSAIKTDDPHTGCENARVEWSKKMSEQSFITLLNCVVRDLNRNGTSVSGYVRHFEKRLKTVECSVKALEDKIDLLISVLRPSEISTPSAAASHSRIDELEQISILPPAKAWRALYRMYWKADPSRHLFKPICEWTPQERKKSGSLPSRLSVAKLIAEDVVDFALQKRIPAPRDVSEATLSMHAAYYVDNWMKDAANTNLNALAIDTLARYIRLDKKRRLVKAQHAYMNR